MYHHLHIQPSELEAMEYYEFHYLMKELVEFLKTQNKENAGQQESAQGMTSGMKMPNMKMPNMKMPKM